MKRIIWVAFIFSLCFGVTSCGKLTGIYSSRANGRAGIKKISQFKDGLGTLSWAYYDATKRSSLIYVSEDGIIRVLAENTPDVALSTISNLTAKAKIFEKVDAEATLSTSRTIAELGKRTVSVNLLRDALYRLHELYYATQQSQKILTDSLLKGKSGQYNIELASKILDSNRDKSLSNEQLVDLYKEILRTTKEISIKEAEVSVDASKADMAKAEKEQERFKAINKVLATDSLSTKDKKEFIQLISK
jgi:hypothetical protein